MEYGVAFGDAEQQRCSTFLLQARATMLKPLDLSRAVQALAVAKRGNGPASAGSASSGSATAGPTTASAERLAFLRSKQPGPSRKVSFSFSALRVQRDAKPHG